MKNTKNWMGMVKQLQRYLGDRESWSAAEAGRVLNRTGRGLSQQIAQAVREGVIYKVAEGKKELGAERSLNLYSFKVPAEAAPVKGGERHAKASRAVTHTVIPPQSFSPSFGAGATVASAPSQVVLIEVGDFFLNPHKIVTVCRTPKGVAVMMDAITSHHKDAMTEQLTYYFEGDEARQFLADLAVARGKPSDDHSFEVAILTAKLDALTKNQHDTYTQLQSELAVTAGERDGAYKDLTWTVGELAHANEQLAVYEKQIAAMRESEAKMATLRRILEETKA